MTDAVQVEGFVESTVRESWDIFKADWVLYVLAAVLLFVISFFSLGLLAPTMLVGFIKLTKKRMRGEPGTATDVFQGFSQFGASLIAMILIAIGSCIGFALLFLPGLIFAVATAFTPSLSTARAPLRR